MKPRAFLLCLLFLAPLAYGLTGELNTFFFNLVRGDAFEGTKTIAVMPFKTGEKVPPEAGLSLAEFAVSNLAQSGKYKVVERENLSKVLMELDFAQSDLTDSAAQEKVAKLAAADRMLVGSITEAFGQRLVSGRIVDVQTGAVTASATMNAGPADLDAFSKELLGEKGQFSAVFFRSLLVPGWGQFYANHPVRGGVSFAAAASGLGAVIYGWIASAGAQSDWKGFDAVQDADRRNDGCASTDNACFAGALAAAAAKDARLETDYNDAFDRAVLFSAVTAGIWGLNLTDASLAGLESKRKFNLYFSAAGPDFLEMRVSARF